MTTFLSSSATFVSAGNTSTAAGSGTVTGPTSSVIGDIVTWATSDGISITDSSIAFGTAAQYQANTANKALATDKVWSAATLTSITSSTSVTPDFSTGWNFKLTASSSFDLNNPTNQKVGQTGYIKIVQGATIGKVNSWGSNYVSASGSKPILTTTTGAQDFLYYEVTDTNQVLVNLIANVS